MQARYACHIHSICSSSSQIFCSKLKWLRSDRVSASRPAKITSWANTVLTYSLWYAFRENNPDSPDILDPSQVAVPLDLEKMLSLTFNCDESSFDPHPTGDYNFDNWRVLRSVAAQVGLDTDSLKKENKKAITAIGGRHSTLPLPASHGE